ncbi:hypothetical protein CD129_05150 [Mammaliicoccus fleurettii]|nr:hypothetical protein CD129_05150 [Mammaliicoccus fleurettii]
MLILYITILYVHLPGGMARACSLSHILFPQASALYKIVGNIYFFKSCDFVCACLPRGMARACSLSRILFPQASALQNRW